MANLSETGVLTSKDAQILSLKIVNSSGLSRDVRDIVNQLDIYQDLYTGYCMHGSILLNDAMDLFNNYYFCGNEFIEVVIDKPSLNEPISRVFRIYKATDRRKSGNSSQGYLLHFVSPEYMLSKSILVSKAYKKSNPADVVRDILLNYLKVPESRIHRFDECTGGSNIIIPNMQPFQAIQRMTAKAYSTKPKYCYFFFETSKGFNFVSLQTLYQNSTILKNLKYEIKGGEEPDPAVNRNSIDKLSIINDFDNLTLTENAGFASKLLNVDLFNQTFTEYKYSVDSAVGGKALLNPHKPINDFRDITGNTASKAFDSYMAMYANIDDIEKDRENYIDKWMMPRAQHMSLMNSFRFKASLPGDTSMNVGDIVNFSFPKFVAADDSGKEFDEYRSGKYLVTAIKHSFNYMNNVLVYDCIAEFSSDSLAAQIPDAKDLVKGL